LSYTRKKKKIEFLIFSKLSIIMSHIVKFEVDKIYKWKSYNTCEQTNQYDYKYYLITRRTEKTIWWKRVDANGVDYSFWCPNQTDNSIKFEGRCRVKICEIMDREEIVIKEDSYCHYRLDAMRGFK
jgi:hypothetical protein